MPSTEKSRTQLNGAELGKDRTWVNDLRLEVARRSYDLMRASSFALQGQRKHGERVVAHVNAAGGLPFLNMKGRLIRAASVYDPEFSWWILRARNAGFVNREYAYLTSIHHDPSFTSS